MTSEAVKCCADPLTERMVCIRPSKGPVFEWPRADLEIQSFIRLASGGIDAGFDRILIK
jgi:hypothetical protein